MFLNIMDHVSAIVPEWAANILPRDLLFLLLWTASALPGIRLAILGLTVLAFPPAGRFLGQPGTFLQAGWPLASSRLAFSILLGQSPRFRRSGWPISGSRRWLSRRLGSSLVYQGPFPPGGWPLASSRLANKKFLLSYVPLFHNPVDNLLFHKS